MKKEGDIFRRFHETFSKMDGHFHILEQRVPVELQMEYFKYSEDLRKDKVDLDEDDYMIFEESLFDPEITTDYKKYILSSLATSPQVRAYRMLEEYVKHPAEDVENWAYLALMESRISLESELSDEKQIYISTGLGGKGQKLRFYTLILSKDNDFFEEYQRQIIEREFHYYLEHADCEVERLTIGEQYIELVFLIPVKTDIKLLLDTVIEECNQYGDFLAGTFTITNVKELTGEEVMEIIDENGRNIQASH